MNAQEALFVSGKYFGPSPTLTEEESGTAVEVADYGPLKPGKPGHKVLITYGDGRRQTAYHASYAAAGDYHSKRRESTRLLVRGFVIKDGVLPNPAPGGRPRVDAYVITNRGRDELIRLNALL